MGRYFEETRSADELDPAQQVRYTHLRSNIGERPGALAARIEVICEYIWPLAAGASPKVLEELLEDAFVTWILANEDPEKVSWADPRA